MVAAPAVVAASARGLAAFAYADIEGVSDWRERLCWPIPHSELVVLGRRVAAETLAYLASLTEPFERQVAVVMAGQFANSFMSLVETAWLCDQAEALSLDMAGGPPELAYLRDAQGEPNVEEFRGPFAVRPVPMPFARAVARTASWTPYWRLPLTVLNAEATAVTYNALLKHAASRRRIGFRHAPNILANARSNAVDAIDVPNLAEGIVDRLIALVPALREVYRERLRRAFVARLGNAMRKVALDVAAIRTATLPSALWSGTNGAYATRVIATEVVRRGGEVDAFDHGGVTGISQVPASTALIELCTSTRFHVATPEWAQLLDSTEAKALAAPINRVTVVGERGDPTFWPAFRDELPRPGKPRVIYLGHPHRGVRQFPIAAIPDAIYWDFQIDLIGKLKAMNIDLLCKPHPEGQFTGRRNPIDALAPTSYRRFEEHLGDADVFLFDAPTSTTFLETLCTRARVVLIDRLYAFNPVIEPHIRARCRIVPGRFDARNRLRVDTEELAEAICGSGEPADPSVFRRLAGARP